MQLPPPRSKRALADSASYGSLTDLETSVSSVAEFDCASPWDVAASESNVATNEDDALRERALNAVKSAKIGGISLILLTLISLVVYYSSTEPPAASHVTLQTYVKEDASVYFQSKGPVKPIKTTASSKSTWGIYKHAVAGVNSQEWYEPLYYYLGTSVSLTNLGCNGTKANVDFGLSTFQLHFVEGSIIEESKETHKTSYWQRELQEAYKNMETFHSLMHNKVQFLVPDIAAIDAHTRTDEAREMFPTMSTMRRISTAGYDNEVEVAHLSLNIGGHIYEVVSPVSNDLNRDGYKLWSQHEFPAAHELGYNPVPVLEQLTANGVFNYRTGGGFVSGVWTSIHVSTAERDMANSNLANDVTGIAGLNLKHYSYGEDFSIDSISGYNSYLASTAIDVAIDPYRNVRYIRNSVDEESDKLTALWEESVAASHQQLYNRVTEQWGSNWDHWLDQHIGLVYGLANAGNSDTEADDEYCGIVADLTVNLKDEKNRPVGLRIDDEETKFYAGYKGLMAWEYNSPTVCGDSADWDQGICTCVHANSVAYNSKLYGSGSCTDSGVLEYQAP